MSYSPLTSLQNAINDIKEYVSRLGVLASVVGTLSDIRVTPTGNVGVTGTLTGVTTVTTVTGQTNIGGYAANNQVPALQNIEATLANINNITIS